MATLKYLSQYFTTALNVGGGIDASQTTGIILLDVSGVDITKPGQICITYSDPIDTSVAEWIDYTSINGSNELVGAVRGREGYSAHAHLQSATVAFVFSASHHNDIVDQLNGTETGTTLTSPVINTGFSGTAKASAAEVATGTEDAKIITPASLGGKSSGATITTGTDDVKYVTAKALADAGVNTRLKSKIIVATRDMTGVDGDVAYTGVGFQPTAIFAMAAINGTIQYSIGMADSSATEINLYNAQNSTNVNTDNTFLVIWAAGGGAQTGALKQFDADGFTITWTKYLTPTGTVTMKFLCFR